MGRSGVPRTCYLQKDSRTARRGPYGKKHAGPRFNLYYLASHKSVDLYFGRVITRMGSEIMNWTRWTRWMRWTVLFSLLLAMTSLSYLNILMYHVNNSSIESNKW